MWGCLVSSAWRPGRSLTDPHRPLRGRLAHADPPRSRHQSRPMQWPLTDFAGARPTYYEIGFAAAIIGHSADVPSRSRNQNQSQGPTPKFVRRAKTLTSH
jgi:hypothetical protein